MVRENHHAFVLYRVEVLRALDDRRRPQHARRERVMDTPRKRIVGVVGPLGAGTEQSRAQ